jgi:hypothetical protein
MSFKSSLVKMAIKLTPDAMVIWVANKVLKGIAEISAFNLDLDSRKAYVQATLLGEAEPIEVWLDGFAIVSDEESHQLIIHQAQSNRPWLSNILSRVTGKAWKIPDLPQFNNQIELASELLKAESPEQEQEQEQEQELEQEREREQERVLEQEREQERERDLEQEREREPD